MAKIRAPREFKLPDDLTVRQLRNKFDGTPYEPRVLLLQELLKKRDAPVSQLADAIERSERQVREYLTILTRKGYRSLLKQVDGTLSDRQIEQVKEEIRMGGIERLEDARDLIERVTGVQLSVDGTRRLLDREIPVRRVYVLKREQGPVHPERIGLTTEKLITFMNGLPVNLDYKEWHRVLNKALSEFLPGRPRILTSTVRSSDLDPHSHRRPGVRIMETVAEPQGAPKLHTSDPDRESVKGSLEGVLPSLAVDPDAYHPPLVHGVYMSEDVYLGSVFVLYPIEAHDLTERASAILTQIYAHLIFLLSDGIARFAFEERNKESEIGRLESFLFSSDLTKREREIFILYSNGSSYREIAEELNISLSTVKNHVSAIRKKVSMTTSRDLAEEEK